MATKSNTVKIDKALFNECLSELGQSLKQFGTYTYDDKGPHEVMDVDVLVGKFRDLDPVLAADTLLALAESEKYDGRPRDLVSAILCEMQDWDELFEARPTVGDYL